MPPYIASVGVSTPASRAAGHLPIAHDRGVVRQRVSDGFELAPHAAHELHHQHERRRHADHVAHEVFDGRAALACSDERLQLGLVIGLRMTRASSAMNGGS